MVKYQIKKNPMQMQGKSAHFNQSVNRLIGRTWVIPLTSLKRLSTKNVPERLNQVGSTQKRLRLDTVFDFNKTIH